VLQLGDRIGEFARPRHRRRHRTGAADRVDLLVVVERFSRGQRDGALGAIDPRCRVDHEVHACAE
jgi:hypothetical protein